jgi:hypothetical protein
MAMRQPGYWGQRVVSSAICISRDVRQGTGPKRFIIYYVKSKVQHRVRPRGQKNELKNNNKNKNKNNKNSEDVMILWCPVGISVVCVMTEMDICGLDSVGIDRALG